MYNRSIIQTVYSNIHSQCRSLKDTSNLQKNRKRTRQQRMHLNEQDASLYTQCMNDILTFMNQKLMIIDPPFTSTTSLSHDDKKKLRQRFFQTNVQYSTTEIVNAYISENLSKLNEEEMNVIRKFNEFYESQFYLVHGNEDGAFMIDIATLDTSKPLVYLVHGITESLSDVLEGIFILPVEIETILLPFKGGIIYDGMITNMKAVDSQLSHKLIKVVMKSIKNETYLTKLLMHGKAKIRNIVSHSNLYKYGTGFLSTYIVLADKTEEKQEVASFIPCGDAEACLCGRQPYRVFSQCCKSNDSWPVVSPAPPDDDTWKYYMYCPQSVKFTVINSVDLLNRLSGCTVLNTSCDNYPDGLSQWIYHGSHQIRVKNQGTICYGDIVLSPEDTLFVTTSNKLCSINILEFLFDIAGDQLVEPVLIQSTEKSEQKKSQTTIDITETNKYLEKFTGNTISISSEQYRNTPKITILESHESTNFKSIPLTHQEMCRYIITSWIFWIVAGIFIIRITSLLPRPM
jgi:hypothetical protein